MNQSNFETARATEQRIQQLRKLPAKLVLKVEIEDGASCQGRKS